MGGGGGGGGYPEGGPVSKKIFLALRASVWSKNKRGELRQVPLGPSPGSATATSDKQISMIFRGQITVFKD